MDGLLIEIVGAVLSTMKVGLVPDAGAILPARSLAVPAAMDIASVPSPVMEEMVTVRVEPDPVTEIVPLAVPNRFSETLLADRVLTLKLASV